MDHSKRGRSPSVQGDLDVRARRLFAAVYRTSIHTPAQSPAIQPPHPASALQSAVPRAPCTSDRFAEPQLRAGGDSYQLGGYACYP